MQKFSMTARLAKVDSEVVGKKDDGGLGLEPQQVSLAEPLLVGLGVKPLPLEVEYFYLPDSKFCLHFHT